jgi:RimJ/RimL family protein N-acetyltransferase
MFTLRRAMPADAEMLHAWRSEPSTSRYQPTRQLPVEAIRRQLEDRMLLPISPETVGKLEWVGEDDGTPVGRISLTIAEPGRRHGIGEIGYAVGEAYRRRGYGSAMVRALLTFAFDPAGFALERLQAVAAIENIASRKVLVGAGFALEGIQRQLLVIHGERVDHAMYALLRTDWEGKR